MQNRPKRQRRSARSAEEWKRTVDAWHRSGLTAKAYSEQHGVAVDNLYRWATRLGRGKRASRIARAGKATPQFVAVEVAAPSPLSPQPAVIGDGLEVEWPSGVVMRFPGHVPQETLATLLRIVTERASC